MRISNYNCRFLLQKTAASILKGRQAPDLAVKKLLSINTTDWQNRKINYHFDYFETIKMCYL
jgi:hypothetical protein